ncbi:Sodium/glucose cotransporter [Planctomycetes bacterium CA13]|uniref:Sodium/glucose cotransporter n=1 Tax=Novipirellula herctigrandis TaxID=2527986 RepID=A0A5C5ZCV4_9BACT|nr:Sodium/glucose cotransporter [Planctomycetes bacterium CA13]
MSTLDYIILIVYLAASLGLGFWCMRRSRDPDSFMVARGRLGGWIVGLSIFGTYVSSISFLAIPGKAFVGNWNAFVFSLSLPLIAWLGAKLFVPFYRRHGLVSAYEHMESQFGTWARLYMSVCFMLLQIARVGSVMFLIAVVMQRLLHWDMVTIIVVTGVLTTLYTCIGGLEGVVLTDALQSVVLIGGAILCAVCIPFFMPEGPQQILEVAAAENKFSLGSFSISEWTESTVWVVMLYALTINFQNVAINQSYTQRYLSAKTEREAKKSVWFGSLLYVPISACFFFIGTSLYCYYTVQPDLLPEDLIAEWNIGKGDAIFPHFIMSSLPSGVRGIMLAAILAAAMSTISSSLNSSATLTLTDLYKRLIESEPSDKRAMMVLYLSTAFWGVAGTGLAMAMIHVKSVLDVWWQMSGVISGGMLGFFLLSYFSRRITSGAAICGVVVGVAVITWLTFSPNALFLAESCRNPLHPFLTVFLGTITITITGFAAAKLIGDRELEETNVTS